MHDSLGSSLFKLLHCADDGIGYGREETCAARARMSSYELILFMLQALHIAIELCTTLFLLHVDWTTTLALTIALICA